MKILGGALRGRNFYMPAGIRPTQNLTRQAVFDLSGHDLSGLTVLDLFAGSGAVGLEAASRGASRVVLVERDPRHFDILRENARLLGLIGGPADAESTQIELVHGDAFAAVKLLAGRGERFDLVYLDPPYERGAAKKALKTLGAYDILQPNCHIFAETGRREPLPEREGILELTDRRKYGQSYLTIYERRPAAGEPSQTETTAS